jgi:hypothetical protein
MMPFEPQNALEKALMQAADDPAQRPNFYKVLVESDLFVIQEGPIPTTSGTRVSQGGDTLQIKNLPWNGKPYIPVFSSLPRLQATLQTPEGYVGLNALTLMKITQGAEFILNPGSDYGKEFTREEIASLIDGSIWRQHAPHSVKEGVPILLGQPAKHPTELVAALTRYYRTIKGVQKAYLALLHISEGDEKPHTLIAVEFSGDWNSMLAGAGMIARDVQVPDPPVDFVRLTGRDGFEDYFRKECQPFYRRKLWGIF